MNKYELVIGTTIFAVMMAIPGFVEGDMPLAAALFVLGYIAVYGIAYFFYFFTK